MPPRPILIGTAVSDLNARTGKVLGEANDRYMIQWEDGRVRWYSRWITEMLAGNARADDLSGQDWGDKWDQLPEAPSWPELADRLTHCDECRCHYDQPQPDCGCVCHGRSDVDDPGDGQHPSPAAASQAVPAPGK